MMPTRSERPSANRPAPSARADATAVQPHPCPVCGGSLVDMRGIHKCQRCSFAMCLGCEATPEDGADE